MWSQFSRGDLQQRFRIAPHPTLEVSFDGRHGIDVRTHANSGVKQSDELSFVRSDSYTRILMEVLKRVCQLKLGVESLLVWIFTVVGPLYATIIAKNPWSINATFDRAIQILKVEHCGLSL